MRYHKLAGFGDELIKMHPPQNALVVTQEQFNTACNPAGPMDGPCAQMMTTWWVVRDGPGGGILYASRDEGDAHTWVSRQEAAHQDAFPEPTAVDMPAPGSDINQGVVALASEPTIFGMKRSTVILGTAVAAAAALFFVMRE